MTNHDCTSSRHRHRIRQSAPSRPSSRRRAGLAKHRLIRRWEALKRYLAGYNADRSIVMALVRCAKQHRDLLVDLRPSVATVADLQAMDAAAGRSLVDAIDAFIGQFGLDRIDPSVLNRESLRDLVLWWLLALRDVSSVESISSLPVRLPARPLIPVVSAADQRVAVTLDDRWNAERETRDAALARMTSHARTLIARQLNTVAERYEDHDYAFVQNRPERDRHIRWLILRVAHRKSPIAIEVLERGAGHAVTAGAIQNATNRLAREIGIRLPKAHQHRISHTTT